MKPGNIPETYADVLTLAKLANSLTYFRPLGAPDSAAVLTLQLDDYEADRRTCVDVRMGSAKCGRVEVKTLYGYQPSAHRWTDYCGPAGDVELPDRRGQKALLAWLATQDRADRRIYGGGMGWTLTRPAPVPKVSALMSRALTY